MDDIQILLVEDDMNVRSTVRSMLIEMDITSIIECSDGREALQVIDKRGLEYDLIICDWNMPHISGIELLNQVRTQKSDLPFLMITARSDETSVLKAQAAEVSAYISKPFSYKELRSKVLTLHKQKLKNEDIAATDNIDSEDFTI